MFIGWSFALNYFILREDFIKDTTFTKKELAKDLFEV